PELYTLSLHDALPISLVSISQAAVPLMIRLPKFTEIARSRCFTTATSGCAKLCTSMVEFGLCSCDCCGLQAVNKAHVMTQTPCKKRNLFIPIFGKYTIKHGIRQALGV